MSLPLLGGGSGHGSGGGGGGAVAWTPTQLGSAVRAWWQADLLAGANGSTVSTVTDSSGNGFTLTTTGGGGTPKLATASQNGLNTLNMGSVDTSRFSPSGNSGATIFGSPAAGSMYLVYKGNALATNYCAITSIGTSGNDSHYPFSDNNHYNDFGSTVRKSCGAATNAVTSMRILSIYSAANDWAYFVDGGTGGSSGGTTALFSTATNTVGWTAGIPLVGVNSGLTNPLVGNIAEIVYTNAKQSTSDRQKMEGYLAWKWGLTGNLDATHPYKSVTP